MRNGRRNRPSEPCERCALVFRRCDQLCTRAERHTQDCCDVIGGGCGLNKVGLLLRSSGNRNRRSAGRGSRSTYSGQEDYTNGRSRSSYCQSGRAALVTLASPLALPVSTTHLTSGGIFGIGLLRGMRPIGAKYATSCSRGWPRYH